MSLESRIEGAIRKAIATPYCKPFWAHYIQERLGLGEWFAFVLSLAYDILVLVFLLMVLHEFQTSAAAVKCVTTSYLPPIGGG